MLLLTMLSLLEELDELPAKLAPAVLVKTMPSLPSQLLMLLLRRLSLLEEPDEQAATLDKLPEVLVDQILTEPLDELQPTTGLAPG